MAMESVWADKHRILLSRNGGPPEVIAMCKNATIAEALASAWADRQKRQSAVAPSEAATDG